MIERTDACNEGPCVPEPMLRIEHNGSKAFARDRFRDVSRTEHAPRAINRLARAQAPGESEGRFGHGSLLIVVPGRIDGADRQAAANSLRGAHARPPFAARLACRRITGYCVSRFF